MRRIRSICLAALLLGLAAPAAQAGRYDIHIYRVTGLDLNGRLTFHGDATGAGIDQDITWTAAVRGRPGGGFSIARGRNVAFFREGVARVGHVDAGPSTGTFTQEGAWSTYEERTTDDANGNPQTTIVPTGQGTCPDRRTRGVSLEATLLPRRGRPMGFWGLPDFPAFRPCGDGVGPEGFSRLQAATFAGVARSRFAHAQVVRLPIRYSRTRRTQAADFVSNQTLTWTGTVTLTRVKTCRFRRGGNQFGCAGGNSDSL